MKRMIGAAVTVAIGLAGIGHGDAAPVAAGGVRASAGRVCGIRVRTGQAVDVDDRGEVTGGEGISPQAR